MQGHNLWMRSQLGTRTGEKKIAKYRINKRRLCKKEIIIKLFNIIE